MAGIWLSKEFLARCDMLLNLAPGWSDGPRLMQACKDTALLLKHNGYPEPEVCPVEDGSMDMNWHWGDQSVMATMNASTLRVTFVGKTIRHVEQPMDLSLLPMAMLQKFRACSPEQPTALPIHATQTLDEQWLPLPAGAHNFVQ